MSIKELFESDKGLFVPKGGASYCFSETITYQGTGWYIAERLAAGGLHWRYAQRQDVGDRAPGHIYIDHASKRRRRRVTITLAYLGLIINACMCVALLMAPVHSVVPEPVIRAMSITNGVSTVWLARMLIRFHKEQTMN